MFSVSSAGVSPPDAASRDAVSSGARRAASTASPLQAAVGAARAQVVAALILSIRVYQWLVSPLLGNCCRFEPSCSRYAQLCIERLGPVRGTWLSLLRVLRCHPFCPGGHDPPPEVTS